MIKGRTGSSSGATMMELLIVVGVVAVLGTIGFTSFVGFRNKSIIAGTAKEVVGSLREVQQRSSSQQDGVQWGVHFNNPASGRDYYEVWYGSAYSSSTITATTTLDSKVVFATPATATSIDIIFQKTTGLPASSSTSTIVLNSTSGGFIDTITVHPNGSIKRSSNY